MAMKIDLILGYVLLVAGSANGLAESLASDKFDPDVKNWQAVAVPSESDEAAYNKFYGIFGSGDWHDSVEWAVKLKDGHVHAMITDIALIRSDSERPKFKFKLPDDDKSWATLCFHRVEDGWLGASNRGEFGSDVLWMSNDGTKTQHMSHHYVWQFIRLNGRHFAVEGIEHGAACEGSVIEFTKNKAQWKVQTLVKLPRAAMAVTVLGDDLCVATSSKLLSVSTDKKVEVLAEGPWEGFYPNSVVIDAKGGYAYIGMRQFVVRVSLWKTGQKPEFLVPSLEFYNKGRR
jgi:hypothetical protein